MRDESEKNIQTSPKRNYSNTNDFKLKRRELISLIQRKTAMFKYKLKTFYLSISLLDKVMHDPISKSLELEAVALVCLLLAGKIRMNNLAKFGEDDAIIPDLNDFGFINYKNFYTVDDIRKYEVLCLHIINFNVKIHTPFSFLYNFCLNGLVFNDETAADENGSLMLKCVLREKVSSNNRLTDLDKLYKMCFDVLEAVILSKYLWLTF